MIIRFSYSLSVGLLLLLTMTVSCNKKDPEPENKLNPLYGHWTWLKSCGGLSGGCKPADKIRTIEFKEDGTLLVWEDGNPARASKFSIAQGKSIYSTEPQLLIQYDSTNIKQSYQVNGDTLKLRDEIYDGFEHQYIKTHIIID